MENGIYCWPVTKVGISFESYNLGRNRKEIPPPPPPPAPLRKKKKITDEFARKEKCLFVSSLKFGLNFVFVLSEMVGSVSSVMHRFLNFQVCKKLALSFC